MAFQFLQGIPFFVEEEHLRIIRTLPYMGDNAPFFEQCGATDGS
jgi:hypothetical protein